MLRLLRPSGLLVLATLTAPSLFISQPLGAQSSEGKARPAGADWPMFNRDLAGTRYSPLTQITPANVANLKVAWTYRFNEPGKPPIAGDSPTELYQEITPIVVNGVMYMPSGNRVVALQPESGKEIWRYELPKGLASFRGVAYCLGIAIILRAFCLPLDASWWR